MVVAGKIWKMAQAILRLPEAEGQHKSVFDSLKLFTNV